MDWKLEVVSIPVSDIDKAKRFYGEQVGFVVDHDTQISPGVRVVQLTPRGSACSIVIGAPAGGVVKGLQLVVPDIEAARAELAGRGVEVSEVKHYGEDGCLADGKGGRWNSFVFFNDLDGNGWVLQEGPGDE
jgi:catechol 2,3-dioxygenase-like lactoylglutathione lyase family enzyme